MGHAAGDRDARVRAACAFRSVSAKPRAYPGRAQPRPRNGSPCASARWRSASSTPAPMSARSSPRCSCLLIACASAGSPRSSSPALFNLVWLVAWLAALQEAARAQMGQPDELAWIESDPAVAAGKSAICASAPPPPDLGLHLRAASSSTRCGGPSCSGCPTSSDQEFDLFPKADSGICRRSARRWSASTCWPTSARSSAAGARADFIKRGWSASRARKSTLFLRRALRACRCLRAQRRQPARWWC